MPQSASRTIRASITANGDGRARTAFRRRARTRGHLPATPGPNGITHEFRERAGAHYVDTGITESHAVAYAAGIARAGGTPVVATTASFFQRAYDQFFQEMSLNRSRVTVILIFWAALVRFGQYAFRRV